MGNGNKWKIKQMVSLKYGISEKNFEKIIADEKEILKKANKSNLELQSKKRLPTPEVERHLYSWVKERQKIGGNISREMVKKKALQIQSYLDGNDKDYRMLKFGDTWIFNFLKRCNLGSTIKHGQWTWTENSDQKQSNFDDGINWDLIKSKLPSITISKENSEDQLYQKTSVPSSINISSQTSKNQAHEEENKVRTNL